MLANAEGCHQDTQKGKWLRHGHVGHIVFQGISIQEECFLKINLWENNGHQSSSSGMLADGIQIGCDTQLNHVRDQRCQPGGTFHPQQQRDGLETEFPIALHRFEIIDNSDTETYQRVEDGPAQ